MCAPSITRVGGAGVRVCRSLRSPPAKRRGTEPLVRPPMLYQSSSEHAAAGVVQGHLRAPHQLPARDSRTFAGRLGGGFLVAAARPVPSHHASAGSAALPLRRPPGPALLLKTGERHTPASRRTAGIASEKHLYAAAHSRRPPGMVLVRSNDPRRARVSLLRSVHSLAAARLRSKAR